MGSTESDKPDLEKFKEFIGRIENDKILPQNMSKLLKMYQRSISKLISNFKSS